MTADSVNTGRHRDDMDSVFVAVGAELKRARRAARISESAMAKKLRVLPRYVRAIEAGNHGEFTSMVYAIGHVRSYAGFVGLDAEPLCRRLRNSLTSEERKPEYNFITNRFAPREFSGRLALAALTILAVGYGSWYMLDSGPAGSGDVLVAALDEGVPSSSVTTIGEPDAGALASRVVIADSITPRTSDETISPIETAPVETATGTPEAPEVNASAPVIIIAEDPSLPSPRPGGDSAQETIAIAEATPDASEANAPAAEPVVPRAGQAVALNRNPVNEITLRASAVSWVEITRADGSALVAWLMRPGDEYTIPGEEDFYLTTGNAGGLAITVGGGEAKSLGEAGETISELPLDPSLLSTRY